MLRRRIAEGEIIMRHVRDEEMPAGCLTKWIPKNKLEKSLCYLCNTHGRAALGDASEGAGPIEPAIEAATAAWLA